MLLSELKPELTDTQINKLLFETISDDNLKGDCIFVFGSSAHLKPRVEKAVELYKQERAPKILFSGLNGKGLKDGVNEAVEMQKYAIQLGVNPNDILIEDDSTNTTENILCSLVVLEKHFKLKNVKHLIMVTSAGHMRRVILTLSKYAPHWLTYSYAGTENDYVDYRWWQTNDNVRKKVYTEIEALIEYAKDGTIDDMNIDFILNNKKI